MEDNPSNPDNPDTSDIRCDTGDCAKVRMSLDAPEVRNVVLDRSLFQLDREAYQRLRKHAREAVQKIRNLEATHDGESGHDHPVDQCSALTVAWNVNVYGVCMDILNTPAYFAHFWRGHADRMPLAMLAVDAFRGNMRDVYDMAMEEFKKSAIAVVELLAEKEAPSTVAVAIRALTHTQQVARNTAFLRLADDRLSAMVSFTCVAMHSRNMCGIPGGGYEHENDPAFLEACKSSAWDIKCKLKRYALELLADISAELSSSN